MPRARRRRLQRQRKKRQAQSSESASLEALIMKSNLLRAAVPAELLYGSPTAAAIERKRRRLAARMLRRFGAR